MSFKYDVFISYTKADRDWAEHSLGEMLRATGIRVATEYTLEEYMVGEPELRNIEHALQVCRRVIVVLSPEALNDPLRDFSGEAARALDPAARERKLLPLVLKPCKLPDWVGALRLKAADFTDEKFRAAEMGRLVRSIQYTIPPPSTLPERPGALWRWRLRYYRRQIALGAVAAVIGVLALWIGLQLAPFEPRPGWRPLGLNDRDAKWLFHFGETLLVATDTTTGCKGPDTGLWRSDDHGATWQRISVPELDFGPEGKCDRAAMNEIVQAPVQPNRLYAATSDTGLLRSDNLGLEWNPVGEKSLPVRQLFSVARLTNQMERLYVTGNAGLWRSDDEGATWQRLDGADVCRDSALGVNLPPSAALKGMLLAAHNTLYVAPHFDPSPSGLAQDAGLYVSRDGGNCWQLAFPSNLVFNFMALVASPTVQDEILFVAVDRTRPMRQTLYRYNPRERAQNLWETDSPIFGLLYDAEGKSWYASTVSGEVWTGLVRATSTDALRALGTVQRCRLQQCYCDIAPGFKPGPPLFLTDGRVFEWATVPWREAMFQ